MPLQLNHHKSIWFMVTVQNNLYLSSISFSFISGCEEETRGQKRQISVLVQLCTCVSLWPERSVLILGEGCNMNNHYIDSYVDKCMISVVNIPDHLKTKLPALQGELENPQFQFTSTNSAKTFCCPLSIFQIMVLD